MWVKHNVKNISLRLEKKFMKRSTSATFIVVTVLLLTSCQKHDADAQDIKLARDLADAFGRTSANSVVEFQSCGMMECRYQVWFTTEEGKEAAGARIVGEISSRGLMTGRQFPYPIGQSVLNDLNGALPQTATASKDRLVLTSGSYSASNMAEWELVNRLGEVTAAVKLYVTKDSGASFAFGSKVLSGNIMLVMIYVNPRKP